MPEPTGTPYSSIFDLFISQIEDYRLIDLYRDNPDSFTTYLTGFMILAIPEFSNCTQDLSLRDDTTHYFTDVITDENIKILSKLMVKEWLSKEVKDIMQMRWNLTDSDFKHYSEAQNTKSKQDLLLELKEECSQMLSDYGMKNNDWASWLTGTFYVP
ncbi:MAG: hypothetical protein WA061_02315 [Microgenomates group bacterium]